jgi:hypothetical protein
MLAMMIAPAGGAGALPLLLGVGGAGVGAGAGAGVELPEPDPDAVVELDDPAEPDDVVVLVSVPPATGVVDEDETPDELPVEPVNAVVVVPGDLVRAFVPPHPVTQNAAILRAAMAQIPFRFNRIINLSVGGGPTVRSKYGGIYSGYIRRE